MTTALDTRVRPKVVSLLATYGTSYTVTVDSGTYNPATGTRTSSTTDYTVTGSPPTPFDNRFIDGDLIQSGDMKVIIAGQGQSFTPAVGQTVTHGTRKFKVVAVDELYSGDLVAAYRLQLRR